MSNIRHNHQIESLVGAGLVPARISTRHMDRPTYPPAAARISTPRTPVTWGTPYPPPRTPTLRISTHTSPTLAIIQGGGCRQIESATGVLQAMDEANIHIDQYRGASAGAIVAALHASGLNAKAIAHLLKQTPVDRLFNFSILQAAKLFIPFARASYIYNTTGLHKLLADYMTESATAKVQVAVTRYPSYDSEMLAATHETVLASAAIPEVFPSVKLGNYTYIDGGIINNIPTCKIQEISNYKHIYIILCNADTKTNKRSWTALGRALKAINETGEREAHQIKESGWGELPNVTVIQPPPYRSHLLEWSDKYSLITHAYNHAKKQISKEICENQL